MSLQRVEVDPLAPFADQIKVDFGPVTVIVGYGVEPQYREEFLLKWADESRHMLAQPGCLTVQMYQGLAGSPTILEVASWESTADLRAAVSTEGYKRLLEAFPPCTSSPQILEPLAVPGICAGEPLRSVDRGPASPV
jgi:quinol monooxygenase YgiN